MPVKFEAPPTPVALTLEERIAALEAVIIELKQRALNTELETLMATAKVRVPGQLLPKTRVTLKGRVDALYLRMFGTTDVPFNVNSKDIKVIKQ